MKCCQFADSGYEFRRAGAWRGGTSAKRTFWARRLTIPAVVMLAIGVALQPQSAHAATGSSPECRGVTIPVHAILGQAPDQRIYGHLCQPSSGPSAALQVLVPGFTYDYRYWDFPGFGGTYSYQQYMADAGYSTLAIDQLGTGQSSVPPAATVSINSAAENLHDIVQAARNGDIVGHTYQSVVTVGHSMGSGVVYVEAGIYRDVNGVIATGANLPLIAPITLGVLATDLVPASLDPVTGPTAPADPGYATTRVGTRSTLFYAQGDADPAVIAEDEETKNWGSLTEVATTLEYDITTSGIRAPVLVAVGQDDAGHCAQGGGGALVNCANSQTLHNALAPYFSPEAALETYVLPDAGHDMNLALNAPLWFGRAVSWMQEHFPLGR